VELDAPLKVRMRRTEVRPKPDDSRRAFHLQSGDYPKDYTGLFPTALVGRFAKKAFVDAGMQLEPHLRRMLLQRENGREISP